jgi:gluconolactonase
LRAVELDVLARDLGFVEGPVFMRSGEIAVVSMDRGCLYVLDKTGTPRAVAVSGIGPNGAAEAGDGSLYVAISGFVRSGLRPSGATGGIQVVEANGGTRWLSQDLVRPNDLCFGPDGLLYVTDPTPYTIRPFRDDGRIWRIDPQTGDVDALISTGWYPNGIAFGTEDDAVYVASTGDQRIMRVPIASQGFGVPEPVIRLRDGQPDGLAFDAEQNLIVAAINAAPGTIQVWTLDGELIDSFAPGESALYTNVALNESRELIVTDSTGGAVLVVDDWPYSGLPLHPFRGG